MFEDDTRVPADAIIFATGSLNPRLNIFNSTVLFEFSQGYNISFPFLRPEYQPLTREAVVKLQQKARSAANGAASSPRGGKQGESKTAAAARDENRDYATNPEGNEVEVW